MEALQILVKNMEKKDIRKQVFAQRAKTSEAFVQQQSSLIAGKIFALPQFQDASCIYVYMDYNKEASTRPIIEEAWRLGKKVAAPKVFGGICDIFTFILMMMWLRDILIYRNRMRREIWKKRQMRRHCFWCRVWHLIKIATAADMERDFMTAI